MSQIARLRDTPVSQERNAVIKAAAQWAEAGAEERGAVFTRREVVEFILDLSGYTIDQPLYKFRLLEPSFGYGDFLSVAVDRLITSYLAQASIGECVQDLAKAIRAVEVHRASIQKVKLDLVRLMTGRGFSDKDARELADTWIIEGDFLLIDLPHNFTHTVGNPPYIRQETIPDALMGVYRSRYFTIYDRADLYIPFIERSLLSLENKGKLCFICSDRWMKNKYGGRLRQMIAEKFHLAAYVDMVDTAAFMSDVNAYPAITMITREKPAGTRIAHRPKIESETLSKISYAMRADTIPKEYGVLEVQGIAKAQEPWILQSFDQLAVVRRLESEFPTIEDAGCKVGIGVATGADKVYIAPLDTLDVEPDRKLPLVTTNDIKGGTVEWLGLGVINPFDENGKVVDLAQYPRLQRYFQSHEEKIRNRNCAKKNPKAWYRTIDRIYPELVKKPKLLIPDIKGEAHIVYEDGQLYPHHNLYFVTSDEWDLLALQTVLSSGIAKLFVSAYSTQIRGGYLRFQAQYLRRIRLPKWSDVPQETLLALIEAAKSGDVEACNRATFNLYRMTDKEQAALGGRGEN